MCFCLRSSALVQECRTIIGIMPTYYMTCCLTNPQVEVVEIGLYNRRLVDKQLAGMSKRYRVKARHGVKIIGARSSNESQWQIKLDLSHRLHGAVVTAAVVDAHATHLPSDRYAMELSFLIQTK